MANRLTKGCVLVDQSCLTLGEQKCAHHWSSKKRRSKLHWNEYCVLMHIYRIQENGTDGSICRAGIEVQTLRMDCGHSRRRRGRDRLRACVCTDIHTLPWVRQTGSRKQLCSAGSSARCSVATQRGGWGWGAGEIQERGCTYAHSWFTLYSRDQHNAVQQLSSN